MANQPPLIGLPNEPYAEPLRSTLLFLQGGATGDPNASPVLPIPRTLGRGALPMIMPPNSTSLSAAGALVLATALDQTYANCFMWFPANAVATVSAAGMYFVQMSSATNGTVFQNPYLGGTPVVPTALIACTTASTYTQTTGSAVTVTFYTVPGNGMGLNGEVTAFGQYRNNNSAGAKTHTMAFGGTAICTLSTTTNQSTAAQRNIINRAATNLQSVQAAGSNGIGASAGLPPALAIDTTANVILAFQLQLAVATDWAILDSSSALLTASIN